MPKSYDDHVVTMPNMRVVIVGLSTITLASVNEGASDKGSGACPVDAPLPMPAKSYYTVGPAPH